LRLKSSGNAAQTKWHVVLSDQLKCFFTNETVQERTKEDILMRHGDTDIILLWRVIAGKLWNNSGILRLMLDIQSGRSCARRFACLCVCSFRFHSSRLLATPSVSFSIRKQIMNQAGALLVEIVPAPRFPSCHEGARSCIPVGLLLVVLYSTG
jgi:hypothetical protein